VLPLLVSTIHWHFIRHILDDKLFPESGLANPSAFPVGFPLIPSCAFLDEAFSEDVNPRDDAKNLENETR
jgi:hypothetical protein